MLPLRRPRLTRRLSRPVSSAPLMLPEVGPDGGTHAGAARSAGTTQAALGQVVLEPGAARRHRDEAVLGPDGGQHGQVALHLAPDPAESDAEHALAALQQV